VGDFLGNPVTWKGLGYLFLKLPLGIVTSNFGDVVNAKATASWTDEEIDRLGNSGKTEIVVNQDDD